VLGFGITLDVDDLPFAVLDRDRSPASRMVIDAFEGSRYFRGRAPAADSDELDRLLRAGSVRMAVEVPSRFGEDLVAGRRPQIGLWIDGAMPFRGETARAYALGIEARLADRFVRELGRTPAEPLYELRTRFRYNQELESVYAIVPGVLALVMILFPTMLMSVAVVREKELGSIANFQATPLTRLEFLLGKQLPYVGLSAVAFAIGVVAIIVVFGVPLTGSPWALALGGLVYVFAATGLGLLISSFTRTQIAAVVAATVLTILPTVEFSGMFTPVSSLTGVAAAMGRALPGSYFHAISVGAFTKGLGLAELWPRHLALAGFGVTFTAAAASLLRKQERHR
jgi:ribosome-dependent ATPase